MYMAEDTTEGMQDDLSCTYYFICNNINLENDPLLDW